MSLALLSALLLAGGLAACDQANEGAENPPPPSEAPDAAPQAEPEAAVPQDTPEESAGTEAESGQTDAGAPAYAGIWAADLSWCTNEPGSSDAVPITITADTFSGLENECTLSDVDEMRGVWRATMACTGEGQESEERISLAPSGERMVITYHDRDGATAYQRCAD